MKPIPVSAVYSIIRQKYKVDHFDTEFNFFTITIYEREEWDSVAVELTIGRWAMKVYIGRRDSCIPDSFEIPYQDTTEVNVIVPQVEQTIKMIKRLIDFQVNEIQNHIKRDGIRIIE